MVRSVSGKMTILAVIALVGVAIVVSVGSPRAEALPQYAAATGQPCSTCHLDPADGGPRNATG